MDNEEKVQQFVNVIMDKLAPDAGVFFGQVMTVLSNELDVPIALTAAATTQLAHVLQTEVGKTVIYLLAKKAGMEVEIIGAPPNDYTN